MWCWTPLCYKYTQIRRYSRSRASKINDSNIDVINDGGNYDNDDNDVNSFYDEKKKRLAYCYGWRFWPCW